MRFWRFLANVRVTVVKLVEGWSTQTRTAAQGLHVLAIQDTSDIKFPTSEADRRALGKVGKGNVFGVLLHAMIGVDARSGLCLGLVTGKIWTRGGDVTVPHARRRLRDKESHRWIETARTAKDVLSAADMITIIGDREEEFYAAWALIPEGKVHLLTRVMTDHALQGGGTLRQGVDLLAIADRQTVELRERLDRKPREAKLALRFATFTLARPKNSLEKDLAESVTVSVVEVEEQNPPKGNEPVHWLLITTHKIRTAAEAWKIVGWYKQRWIVEQFFRTMKSHGLKIEDSQIKTAERLEKLVAIAAKAAMIVIQLVQARDGTENQPASFAFSSSEIAALHALNKTLQGSTELQKNPHPKNTLPWAAWIIAKLGGWSGYPSHKPPGPITFHNGLKYFQAFAEGWAYKNV